jgi:ferrous iron transport protein B
MFDELENSGNDLDHRELGRLLGIPVIPTIGSKGKGLDRLLSKIVDVYEGRDETVRHIHINYGNRIEEAIREIRAKVNHEGNYHLTDKMSQRFLAIKLLEKDAEVRSLVQTCVNKEEILETTLSSINRIESDLAEDSETLITDAKYGFIGGALLETMKPNPEQRVRKSEIIDALVTHKFWGIPVFLFFMWFSFYVTFKVGRIYSSRVSSGALAASSFSFRTY